MDILDWMFAPIKTIEMIMSLYLQGATVTEIAVYSSFSPDDINVFLDLFSPYLGD